MASHVCGIYGVACSLYHFWIHPFLKFFWCWNPYRLLSSGRHYIPSASLYSNINLAFCLHFLNLFVQLLWINIKLHVLRRLQFEMFSRCFVHPFSLFLLLKLMWISCSAVCAWQPQCLPSSSPSGGWEFWVLADPFLQGMSTLVLKWWRASRRSAVISEWSSFRALGGEMAGKRPAMGTVCIMLLGLAGTQQPSER